MCNVYNITTNQSGALKIVAHGTDKRTQNRLRGAARYFSRRLDHRRFGSEPMLFEMRLSRGG
jgi:hypothetical protein